MRRPHARVNHPRPTPASLIEPAGPDASEHEDCVAQLRACYRQYRNPALESRPLIRVVVEHVTGWRAFG
jgi:hypothetical protein